MKRALLPLLAAVVLLAACGDGDDTPASPEQTTAAVTDEDPTTTVTPASVVNEQVRQACQAAVTAQAPGATFADPGTLRGSSSADGKLFSLTGTAQVAGVDTPYTCSALAADTVTVSEVTVG